MAKKTITGEDGKEYVMKEKNQSTNALGLS